MAYTRRIVGARASKEGKTTLKIKDGTERFEVEVMDYGGRYRRTDNGREVEKLIDPDKVDLKVYDLGGKSSWMLALCLGKPIPREKVQMRTTSRLGQGVFSEHDDLGQITWIPKTAGDMGFCRLGVFEDHVEISPIFIPEMYRGFGLARRLLEDAEWVARLERKDTLKGIVAKENKESNSLFESMGYTRSEHRGRRDVNVWIKKIPRIGELSD
ncbi:MAG: GNAT family N-acetyltransferase [Candidatus Altiarchaeota archaeon]